MSRWGEIEARIHRTRSAADLTETIRRRLVDARCPAGPALLTATLLAQCYFQSVDLVKIIDALLMEAEGDRSSVGVRLLQIREVASGLRHFARRLELPLVALLEAIGEADRLGEVDVLESVGVGSASSPEEAAKLDGRYRDWHLLFERLDMKLASAGAGDRLRRGLARDISEIYEELISVVRSTDDLASGRAASIGRIARCLTEINAALHFHLLPNHLGESMNVPGEARALPALLTWIILFFDESTGG